MSRKGKLTVILILAIMILTACGSKSQDSVSSEVENTEQIADGSEETLQETPQGTEQEDVLPEIRVLNIYYSNEMADGLEKVEMEADTLSPELLLSKLADYNIVPRNTSVNSIETVKEGEETVLLLDLSKEFEQHVSSMGTSGEYVIVAAVTNTFLDAYDAQRLRLRIEDNYMESGHAIYDWDLTKYQLTSYTVESKTYEKDHIRLEYPQLLNLKEPYMEDEWNEVLEAYARKGIDFLSERSEYKLNYEVATATEELLSIIYRIDHFEPGAARPYKSVQTFNIDLTTGKEWRLKDFINLDRVVECLETGDFELINTEISKKDFQDYLAANTARLTAEEFEAYDLDSANIRDYIPGYSYRLDDRVVVCMEVAAALGDYVEVAISR